MWPRGDDAHKIAIIEDRISKVEVALVEAYANMENANVAMCRQRLDELNLELDRLIPKPRPPAD